MNRNKLFIRAFEKAPFIVFGAFFLAFSLLSPKFSDIQNLINILVQSSSAAIVAIGMTFVLLTAGIDLSVGSIMFVSAAVAGKMLLDGWPSASVLLAATMVGLAYGAINGIGVARLRILPFIVTLATLFVGRGLGLWITETRAMNLPDEFTRLGTARIAFIPLPILVLLAVLVSSRILLRLTTFGRQIYAVGEDFDAALKAGINTRRILILVYMISGLCAALGALVSLAQLGAVSPTFGNQRELAAVAAAVIGGTSLFGGRGEVFPGTIMGAVLIQMIENGLVILNADPYLYPLITAGIIFLAVALDSARTKQLEKLRRRMIRVRLSTSEEIL